MGQLRLSQSRFLETAQGFADFRQGGALPLHRVHQGAELGFVDPGLQQPEDIFLGQVDGCNPEDLVGGCLGMLRGHPGQWLVVLPIAVFIGPAELPGQEPLRLSHTSPTEVVKHLTRNALQKSRVGALKEFDDGQPP